MSLGILRYQLSLPAGNNGQIQYYNEEKVELIGLVAKEPDARQDKVRLEIKAEQILLNNNWQPISGKVLVTNFLYPEFAYGDKLKIACVLRQPGQIEDFSYDKYLARYDIYSVCYNPQIEIIAKEQGNFFIDKIYDFKNYFIAKLNKVLPEPHSSFLAGLLIGAKKSIPENLQQVFSRTGTTHIVAVSGYNVSIIAAFLMLFLQNLGVGRKKSFWLIMILLSVFLIITGLQASIIRAGIMGGLVLLSGYLGRVSRIRIALALAAAIMLFVNPKILVFDLGFQLSFLATLGLVYLNPVLAGLLKVQNWSAFGGKIAKAIIGDYLLTTMSAIIMTTPLILYNFGKITLIAPLANILILPFIPLAMLLGFITGILSLISLKLGWVAGWSVWLVLQYIIWVLHKLSSLNWAYWEVEKISLWLMIGMYIVIGGVIWRGRRKAHPLVTGHPSDAGRTLFINSRSSEH